MNTEMSFMFKGCGDKLPSKAETGDVFIVGKQTYVYADGWQWIDGSLKDKSPKKEIPANCKNCGGLINRYKRKCEFCGTVYEE